ncbi:hypothetical protein EVAR_44711_1 [Eumeta japonica]|uniref:Uncharacterized protein n=1 Tax=Eumeta variegata TaxID=151549 RepID=A0A4C1XG46_EUMVA|nr:hypothetical protein EVAR_44711_1 [Eumeta japonica]
MHACTHARKAHTGITRPMDEIDYDSKASKSGENLFLDNRTENSPHHILWTHSPSIGYPVPTQKAGNPLATALKLQVSVGDGDWNGG